MQTEQAIKISGIKDGYCGYCVDPCESFWFVRIDGFTSVYSKMHKNAAAVLRVLLPH